MKNLKKFCALLLVLCTMFAFASCKNRGNGDDVKPEATLAYVNHVLKTAPTKVSAEVKTTVPEFGVTLTSSTVLQTRIDAAGKYSKYTYSVELFAGLGSEELTKVERGTAYTRGNTYRNEAGKDVLYQNGVIAFDAFALPQNTAIAEISGEEGAYTATVSFDSAASKGILGYGVNAQGQITLVLTVKGGVLASANLSYTAQSGSAVAATCVYDYTTQSFK